LSKVFLCFDIDDAVDTKKIMLMVKKQLDSMHEELPGSSKNQEGNIPLKQIELATDKQKWRMKQLNIKFDDSTTKSEAHQLISEKMDSVEGC